MFGLEFKGSISTSGNIDADNIGQFLEVTPGGEIVWHARLADYTECKKPLKKGEIFKAPCFNADRRGMPYYGGR